MAFSRSLKKDQICQTIDPPPRICQNRETEGAKIFDRKKKKTQKKGKRGKISG